jgi:hypothetical protein
MNSTSLSILLTTFFMRPELPAAQPEELLDSVKQFLTQHRQQLGQPLSCRCLHRRRLSNDMQVASYELRYASHRLLLNLTYFAPRGRWEIQDLKWSSRAAA